MPKRSSTHIRGFDGLRAVAMLLVFVMHKTAWGAGMQLGFSGVWLFFLLSGFLIGGQLWVARDAVEARRSRLGQELGLFWLKRALRIFPAYYVLIALLVPFYLSTAREIPGLASYLTYLSNFHFQRLPADFLTTWAHFWSLAVEEQFYVLFAPLMLLVPLRHASKACAAVVLASLAQRFGLASFGVQPYVIYVDSLVNFGLLALGAMLFIHRGVIVDRLLRLGRCGGLLGWFALGALAVAAPVAQAVAGSSLILLQVVYVVAVLTAALVLMSVFARQSSLFVRTLEWRPLAYAGRISYGLYLYNDYVKADIPERAMFLLAERGWLPGQSPATLQATMQSGSVVSVLIETAGLATCLVLLVAVAHLSWIVVERPALRSRHRLAAWLRTRSLSRDARGTKRDVAPSPSAVLK